MTSNAFLCEVCSKLDKQLLSHPVLPCRDPASCSTPPTNLPFALHFKLGSVKEIKSRRLICSICRLVAECLDNEPPDLDGKCRIKEAAQYCNFELPGGISARDPATTHFHLIQTSVIFDPAMADELCGPSFPWEMKEKDRRGSHFIMHLQARARSLPETGDHAVQTEQELFELIGGRYVGTQVNTQLIRKWLHDCESEHGEQCQHLSQFLMGEVKAPRFVIDVIQKCIVDTPSQCRYVALSYVWGKAPIFRHLLENNEDLRRSNSLYSFPIPATIRDAITLVHAIGERYLWVDSICIVQDDLKMQQGEIMRMGSIYSNALFTIIAAAGDHANSGLPGVEPGSREQVQKIVKLEDTELLTVIDFSRNAHGIDNTIWAERGWTFQERVLSNRLLVFSEKQVYWSCRVVTHSEEKALEGVRDINRHHFSFPEKPNSYLSRELQQPNEYRYLYDRLLSSYRERRLTYQSDILDAFRGVTETLRAIQNDTFLWGLPESFFSYAITWNTFGHCTRNNVEVPIFKNDGSQEMIPIPSWSWAAWTADEWRHLAGNERTLVLPVIQFHLVDSTHKLVRVKDQSWQDPVDNQIRASWQNVQPHTPQPPPSHSPSQIGQLSFWTSYANVMVIRTWIMDFRAHGYALLPSPDFQLHPEDVAEGAEIVHQDFIVVAAYRNILILLAIEWKDGIAYRIGKAEFMEAEWVQVESRQWRLITLG